MFTRAFTPPKRKSFFLFGPRQTGKSTLVRDLLTTKDAYIDLLPQRNFLDYAKQPGRLREEMLARRKRQGEFTCVIDEIQKIPALLDEVHSLIEAGGIRFVLTGSSARKLVRGGANLLAGRAYVYHLFPLTFQELGERFELERALRVGCLPPLWNSGGEEDPVEFLRVYAETYLREEVAAEGLVRNIGPFAQFLDIAAATDGETLSYSNVARECSLSVKTVQQYYGILEDTFLAHRIPAWRRSTRRRLVSHPRYYLFDPGVTNALCHAAGGKLDPVVRGRRFEQLVITQLLAAIHYRRSDLQVCYWRTNHGAEVDLVLARGNVPVAAVEIKSSRHIASADLAGLRSFLQDNPGVPAFVLGIDVAERLMAGGVTVLDWREFIRRRLGDL